MGGEDFVHARRDDRPVPNDDRAERSAAILDIGMGEHDGFAKEAVGVGHDHLPCD